MDLGVSEAIAGQIQGGADENRDQSAREIPPDDALETVVAEGEA